MTALKPRKIPFEFIREQADAFRRKYSKNDDHIPVPIDRIVEIDLRITPWPIDGLQQKIDVDGFLSNDLKTIYIDKRLYMDPRNNRRLRFTYAHEVGHLILHQDEITSCQFRTEGDWLHFRNDMSEEDLAWFEFQAHEFAGRLLVPKNMLIQELSNHKEKIEEYKRLMKNAENEFLIQAVSRIVCDKFDVTDKVIAKRIKVENII